MKLCTLMLIAAIATASTTALADAGHDAPGSRTAPAAAGKTREQVRQELIQAYHDGLLPASKNDYPPSASTIERNQELHRIARPAWDTHR
ncbi:DUF4148 domain-containing protein [Burkholderia gladioli]|uniref:DUF4148 domain-containing protein n=1 Tax=Burkholderia gladioli TaxID=28095 RepID=UPI0016410636|nr:DUF4148 domain-containing protein [Burkholderia gladioli]